jgi:4-amino-4-deoxy-L-arabinose transferase-like glycosyltransferase
MRPRRALTALVTFATVFHIALGASVGPSNDEAYYALFAVHLDWSYFDHPPLVGWIIWLGAKLLGRIAPVLAMRCGFIALFAASSFVVANLAGRLYGPRAGFLAALALNVTGYFGIIAGTFALPDGPLVFFWLLTLERLTAAVRSPHPLVPWSGVGFALGGALLSKYHAVFLPAGFLVWICLDRSARTWLKRPGPYVALAIALGMFSPVLWWNAHHEWVSFLFQGRRALGLVGFRGELLLSALVGQAVYLLPWMWLLAMLAAARCARRFYSISAAERLLLCQSFWPLAVFATVACRRPIFPHWSLVTFLGLLPLVGRDWAIRAEAQPAAMRWRLAAIALVPALLAAGIAMQARTGFFCPAPRGIMAAAADPTLDLFGWDQVAGGLAERGLLDGPNTFLFTGNWYHSAQLAFATVGHIPVLCYSGHDARGFALWSRPDERVGQDGILVAIDHRSTEPACFDRWFEGIEPIGEFPILRGGVPVHYVRLFRCVRERKAFPFDGSDPARPRQPVLAKRWFGMSVRR